MVIGWVLFWGGLVAAIGTNFGGLYAVIAAGAVIFFTAALAMDVIKTP